MSYEIDDRDGRCLYRGDDLGLACEIHDQNPTARLVMLPVPTGGAPACAAAWSVAADARTKQHAAEADAARARESERRAYDAAQQALDQVDAARCEIARMYALLATAGRSHRDPVRTEGRRSR
jgi:hypothetical protein